MPPKTFFGSKASKRKLKRVVLAREPERMFKHNLN